jgi:hypothetical protein
MSTRVEWSETLSTGTVYYIAERDGDNTWEFSQKDGYETQWFPQASTPGLVAKATQLRVEQAYRESDIANGHNKKEGMMEYAARSCAYREHSWPTA